MEPKMIGKFDAITFDGDRINFEVYDNKVVKCDSLGLLRPIKRMILKPNVTLYFENGQHFTADLYERATGNKRFLIKEYQINEDLLDYMIDNQMAEYSTDCAVLYDFDIEKAYDRKYQTRAFKYVKEKSKRMVKAKQGIFR